MSERKSKGTDGSASPRETWLLRLIDEIDLPAVVFDREFVICSANAAFAKVAGEKDGAVSTLLGSSFLETLQDASAMAAKRLANLKSGAREQLQVWHRTQSQEETPLEYEFIVFEEDHMIGGMARDRTTDLMLIEQMAHLYEELDQRHRELKRLHRKIERLADTDELTNLKNRRAFDYSFEREWARFRRLGSDLSLILIDVDHFKDVNDDHGHVRGDLVLQAIGQILNNSVRAMDICARYGGEEFAIILPETSAEHAFRIAERLRQHVAELSFPIEQGTFQVTISLGVATTSLPLRDKERLVLFVAADTALRSAKQRGRDRVVCAPGALTQESRASQADDSQAKA